MVFEFPDYDVLNTVPIIIFSQQSNIGHHLINGRMDLWHLNGTVLGCLFTVMNSGVKKRVWASKVNIRIPDIEIPEPCNFQTNLCLVFKWCGENEYFLYQLQYPSEYRTVRYWNGHLSDDFFVRFSNGIRHFVFTI
jgi:hypothetical protein